MRTEFRILLLLLSLCLPVGEGAWAQSISMLLNTRVWIEEEVIFMEISVANQGAADALKVTPHIGLGQSRTRLDTVRWIPFAERKVWRYQVSRRAAGLEENGVYPLSVIVEYHDSNHYPFSVAQLTPVVLGRPPSNGLSLQVESPESIGAGGVVAVELKNAGERVRNIRVRVVAPLEFAFDLPKEAIALAPGETRSLDVPVRNLRALGGSRYGFHFVAEYQTLNGQGMASATGRFKVENATATASERLLGYLALFVLSLFIATVFIESRRIPIRP